MELRNRFFIHLSIASIVLINSSITSAQDYIHASAGDGGCGYLSYGSSAEMRKKIIPKESVDPAIVTLLRLQALTMEEDVGFAKHQVPVFEFIDDSTSPNAFAYRAGLMGKQPYILFGTNLIDKLQSVTLEDFESYAPVIAVLMHEYAHIAQYQEGARGSVKNFELMADVMAGWYIASTLDETEVSDYFEAEDAYEILVKDILQKTYNSGNYDFSNPKFHGTPKERTDAFALGMVMFKHQNLDFWETYAVAAKTYNVHHN